MPQKYTELDRQKGTDVFIAAVLLNSYEKRVAKILTLTYPPTSIINSSSKIQSGRLCAIIQMCWGKVAHLNKWGIVAPHRP